MEPLPSDEPATSVTIITIGYRAKCNGPGCRNLGRVILRHADAGGRPMTNAEFCNAHGAQELSAIGPRGSGFTTIANYSQFNGREASHLYPNVQPYYSARTAFAFRSKCLEWLGRSHRLDQISRDTRRPDRRGGAGCVAQGIGDRLYARHRNVPDGRARRSFGGRRSALPVHRYRRPLRRRCIDHPGNSTRKHPSHGRNDSYILIFPINTPPCAGKLLLSNWPKRTPDLTLRY